MTKREPGTTQKPDITPNFVALRRDQLPLPNYSLSTVCPGCGNETIRRACKVRCERCGFMWDCSEL